MCTLNDQNIPRTNELQLLTHHSISTVMHSILGPLHSTHIHTSAAIHCGLLTEINDVMNSACLESMPFSQSTRTFITIQ